MSKINPNNIVRVRRYSGSYGNIISSSNDFFKPGKNYIISEDDYGFYIKVADFDYNGKSSKIMNHTKQRSTKMLYTGVDLREGSFILCEEETNEDILTVYFK